MRIEECQELILKKNLFVLGVKQADVKFSSKVGAGGDRFISHINFDGNKTTEMMINGLLSDLKFKSYECVVLVHDKKVIMLPITKGSFRYSESHRRILKCRVLTNNDYKIKKSDFENWHLDKNKEIELDEKIKKYLL